MELEGRGEIGVLCVCLCVFVSRSIIVYRLASLESPRLASLRLSLVSLRLA